DIPGGSYTQIILEDPLSCRDTFTFSPALQITPEDAPQLEPFVQNEVVICANELFPIVAEASGGTGSLSYRWSLPDNSTVDQDSLLLADAGQYTVTVTDSVGCATSQSIDVTNLPVPALSFDPSRVIQVQTDSALTISWTSSLPGTFYAWTASSPGNLLPFTTSGADSMVSETFRLEESASQAEVTYVIEASNGQCASIDSIEISILRDTGPENFLIPDVFTPNGDGSNDMWDIRYPISLDPTDFRVRVYNRAGGLVHDKALSTPWTGANLPDGPYFYIITNTADPNAEPLRGAVSIIRRQP
ncbi:MAG: gliding motility-associated C-terminal domain-containing protein, partial [Bacteroidota bacterium]